ncbi:hypothetical protein CEQ90_19610 [Lewinellaceae bacterium SD302]|nr:hypothetical protein CEQ90_19610 [Lewinellaceae bacterium SD302]
MYSGFYGQIEFDWEFLNDEGNWIDIDLYDDLYCGTGYGNFELPPNHYVLDKINLKNLEGDRKAIIRWTYELANTSLQSEKIELYVDSSLMMTKVDKIVAEMDKIIEDTTVKRDDWINAKMTKVKIFLTQKKIILANQVLISLLNEEVENWELYHNVCRSFAIYLSLYNHVHTDKEVYKLVEEIITIASIVPETYEKINELEALKRSYLDFLKANGYDKDYGQLFDDKLTEEHLLPLINNRIKLIEKDILQYK